MMLEVKNICYEVENGKEKIVILNNISFSCELKDNIVITGENGSGKSTLLKILMGILTPTSGKIFFDGKDITNLSIDERAKLGLAYSFQTPVTFKGISVERLLKLAGGENQSYCNVLSKLGMCAKDYLSREVDKKLSGGEQKRIDLASVLLRNAKLNLFDEPEAGIDIWSFDTLVDVFSNGKANIIVSHQRKLIEKADKILLLKNGNVCTFDKTEKVLPLLSGEKICKKLRRENGSN